MAAKARKSRARKTPTPSVEETSIVKVRLRDDQRVVTTIEGSGPPVRYDFYGGSFSQISRVVGRIVVDEDLGKRACHLLLILSGEQERGGSIRLTQKAMGKLMASKARPKGWSEQEVSQVLEELREAGLFFKIGKGHYAFDPQAVFRGTASEQRDAIARIPTGD